MTLNQIKTGAPEIKWDAKLLFFSDSAFRLIRSPITHIKLWSMGLLTAKLPPFFASLSQTSTALRKSLGVLSIPQCLQANHAFACQMQATGTETVLVIADDTLTDNNAINVIFL